MIGGRGIRSLRRAQPDETASRGRMRRIMSLHSTEPKDTIFEIQCRNRFLTCGRNTLIMGILNVTPDSFSDGGKFHEFDRAVAQGRKMADEGADIIDIGGESTRPGADPVSPEEEQRRVLPVIEALASEIRTPLSIDTRNSETARLAVEAGVHLINDVSALRHDPAIARIAAESGAGLILMHSRATPKEMQSQTDYEDVVADILESLRGSIKQAGDAGVKRDQMIVDPGIGFGKTAEQNFLIVKRLQELAVLERPVLIGPSRKAFIGHIVEKPPEDRTWGNAAVVAASVLRGAHIVRVHDIAAMVDVCRVADAIRRAV